MGGFTGAVVRILWFLSILKLFSSARKREGKLLWTCGASLAALGWLLGVALSGHGRSLLRVLLGLPAAKCVVKGDVAPGFEAVRVAFNSNFCRGLERGSQLCVYFRGVKVVDLFGRCGVTSGRAQRPYDADTLQVTFSSTKVLTAICVAKHVDRGTLNYDQPIASYWSNFSPSPDDPKARVKLADLMKHQAGLAFFGERLTRADFEGAKNLDSSLSRKIAQAPVVFPPTTRRCYHGITRGLVVNEILARAASSSVGRTLQEDIAGPLGVQANCHVGTISEEIDTTLVADLKGYPQYKVIAELLARKLFGGWIDGLEPLQHHDAKRLAAALKPKSFLVRWFSVLDKKSLGEPVPLANSAFWHHVESPSSNGITNARALARIAAAMANQGELDGVRILSADTVRKMHGDLELVLDDGMCLETANTQGGLTRFGSKDWAPITDGFYGWGGYGGSAFAWHPELQIGFAYTTCGLLNPVTSTVGFADPRCLRNLEALLQCVQQTNR